LAASTTAITPVRYAEVGRAAGGEHPGGIVEGHHPAVGCSWQEIALAEGDLAAYQVAAGPADNAYGYGVNDQLIYRIRGKSVFTVSGPRR
jgi:hypothetical protein